MSISSAFHYICNYGRKILDAKRMVELASALMQEIAPVVDSGVLIEAAEKYPPAESKAGESLAGLDKYQRCVAISIDVMRLCFQPPDQSDTESSRAITNLTSEARHERWKTLLGDLREWYTVRSAGIQALIDRDGAGATFPTVLFTDDDGTFANMMYHIAMYVLLTHRPKSLLFRAEGDRTHMSSLWHAQRVCGIAITSDQQCWDPCMIAAFWFAARRMTHPDQQKDIVACLERLLTASNWRVGGLVDRLREEFLLPANTGA
jgi:hypothetical protein